MKQMQHDTIQTHKIDILELVEVGLRRSLGIWVFHRPLSVVLDQKGSIWGFEAVAWLGVWEELCWRQSRGWSHEGWREASGWVLLKNLLLDRECQTDM